MLVTAKLTEAPALMVPPVDVFRSLVVVSDMADPFMGSSFLRSSIVSFLFAIYFSFFCVDYCGRPTGKVRVPVDDLFGRFFIPESSAQIGLFAPGKCYHEALVWNVGGAFIGPPLKY